MSVGNVTVEEELGRGKRSPQESLPDENQRYTERDEGKRLTAETPMRRVFEVENHVPMTGAPRGSWLAATPTSNP